MKPWKNDKSTGPHGVLCSGTVSPDFPLLLVMIQRVSGVNKLLIFSTVCWVFWEKLFFLVAWFILLALSVDLICMTNKWKMFVKWRSQCKSVNVTFANVSRPGLWQSRHSFDYPEKCIIIFRWLCRRMADWVSISGALSDPLLQKWPRAGMYSFFLRKLFFSWADHSFHKCLWNNHSEVTLYRQSWYWT